MGVGWGGGRPGTPQPHPKAAGGKETCSGAREGRLWDGAGDGDWQGGGRSDQRFSLCAVAPQRRTNGNS